MVHSNLVAHTIHGKDDAIKQSVTSSSMEGYYKYSKVDGQCNVSEKNRLPLFSSDRNLRLIARAQQLTDPLHWGVTDQLSTALLACSKKSDRPVKLGNPKCKRYFPFLKSAARGFDFPCGANN